MTRTVAGPVPDLVVLSHLRWPWVWQRPQHLISRLAAERARSGARTVYVEEPQPADVPAPQLVVDDAGPGMVRVVLRVPEETGRPYRSFDEPGGERYPEQLARTLRDLGIGPRPDAWVYTPLALPFLDAIEPGLVVYDVMDDLASFADAPAGLREKQRDLLALADLVFTGGRSLHRSTSRVRDADVHLFASGVETAHYAPARAARRAGRERPRVAGYIGVVDERLDLQLIADLAAQLEDWTIRIVGPLAKIEEDALPRAANIEYPGMVSYEDLPGELARFDVALMPFALNEATASISPTKTLEYFAAGLPVVSTRVPDVVADCGELVFLADDGAGFAAACRSAVRDGAPEGRAGVESLLRRREWDFIADAMNGLVESTRARHPARRRDERPGTAASAAGDRADADARRLAAAARLHPPCGDDASGLCPTCGVPAPCPTARALL